MTLSLFQNRPENDYLLHPRRVDLWQIPLHQSLEGLPLFLSPEEQHRAGRFHFQKHQRRFAATHHALRYILGRYLNQDPSTLIFTLNNHGKPMVNNHQGLEFNLSHSNDWALIAVGQEHPLGVDLEFFSSRPYQGIANNLFSAKEISALSMAPHALKPLLFFKIWAQKEAVIKACGLGLSYPTQQIDMPLFAAHDDIIWDSLHSQSWRMLSFMPFVACYAALCVNPQVDHLYSTQWTTLDEAIHTS